jgi:phosphocarrier protein HPr
MKEFKYTIKDPVGIHARPAGQLAKEAAKFQSIITIIKGEKNADTRRLMALMGLGIKQGDVITITADGSDEAQAADAILSFLTKNNF